MSNKNRKKSPDSIKMSKIQFFIQFKSSNYDREYLAGIYKFINPNTDSLKMQESGTIHGTRIVYDSIQFDLVAPEKDIDKKFRNIINYI